MIKSATIMEGCKEDNTQELFLIEFLVNKVNIPAVQAMQDDLLQVKTCIEFKILSLPAIFVCQDSPTECCTCVGEDAQVFRKGKSCLFALPSKVLQKPICSFPIVMTVYKKLPPTVLPDVMTIGSNQIDARDMINCLLQENPAERPCKTLKSNFRINTATGQCVGEVGVFLRFSRLGKKIVTQFQSPHNRRPYLFKGLENSPVIQCRRIPSQIPEDVCEEKCICKKEPKCEERPPRTCCGSPPPPPLIIEDPCGAGAQKRKQHKNKKAEKKQKGHRPCCPSKDRSQKKCGSQNESGGDKTRQCGCDIKEDKFSCGK